MLFALIRASGRWSKTTPHFQGFSKIEAFDFDRLAREPGIDIKDTITTLRECIRLEIKYDKRENDSEIAQVLALDQVPSPSLSALEVERFHRTFTRLY